MDDGYISPKRIEYVDECPLCGSKLDYSITPKDPLGQIFLCPNPNCEAETVDPSIRIYGCTICGEDTQEFSDIDDHPYCFKHMPGRVLCRNVI